MDRKLILKSGGYQTNIKAALKMFLERYELTSQELYDRQRAVDRAIALGEAEPADAQEIPLMVAKLEHEMVKNGYSTGYANFISKAVKFFYKANALNYNYDPNDTPSAEPVAPKTYITREQIMVVLDKAHLSGLGEVRVNLVKEFHQVRHPPQDALGEDSIELFAADLLKIPACLY